MRKLISLLVVLGMLFVAGPAMAGWWNWNCPDYNTVALDFASLEINQPVGSANNGMHALGVNNSSVDGEGFR